MEHPAQPKSLGESRVLYDNLYPSRIIVGTYVNGPCLIEKAHVFTGLLQERTIKKNSGILFAGFTEVGAVKLFVDTYLARQGSYFNELDT